jgi:hypothetical protein
MFWAIYYPLFLFPFPKKIKNWELGQTKKVDLDCLYVHLFGLKKFLEFGIFTLCVHVIPFSVIFVLDNNFMLLLVF